MKRWPEQQGWLNRARSLVRVSTGQAGSALAMALVSRLNAGLQTGRAPAVRHPGPGKAERQQSYPPEGRTASPRCPGRQRWPRWLCLLALPWLTAWTAPWSAGRLSRQAREAWLRGDYAQAASDYERAAGRDGERPELLYNLGTSQLTKGDAAAAAETLARVRTDDRRLAAAAHYNRGNALYALGQWEEAAQAYQQTLALDPTDADAQHNLEVCRRRQQRKASEPPKNPPPPKQTAQPPPPQPGAKSEQQERQADTDPQTTDRKLAQLEADEQANRQRLHLRSRQDEAVDEADDAKRQFRGMYGSGEQPPW